MFQNLVSLLEQPDDTIVLTVSRSIVDGNKLRVTVVPQFAANRRGFTPIDMTGTPEEFDGAVDFTPVVDATKSINEAIAASAEATKAAANTGRTTIKYGATEKEVTEGGKTVVQPIGGEKQPLKLTSDDAAAEKKKKADEKAAAEAEKKRKADEAKAAAEAERKRKADELKAKAAAEKKAKLDKEAAALQKKLAALQSKGASIPTSATFTSENIAQTGGKPPETPAAGGS